MTYKIIYTCPAVPPDGIVLSKVYEFGKDKKGFFYADKVKKVYAELKWIKMLFSPVEGTWDDIIRSE